MKAYQILVLDVTLSTCPTGIVVVVGCEAQAAATDDLQVVLCSPLQLTGQQRSAVTVVHRNRYEALQVNVLQSSEDLATLGVGVISELAQLGVNDVNGVTVAPVSPVLERGLQLDALNRKFP